MTEGPVTKSSLGQRSKRLWLILGIALLTIVLGLGVGLGISARQNGVDALEPLSDTGVFWRPTTGTRWQIILNNSVTTEFPGDIPIYDLDLFLTNATTIAALHARQQRVICYFSAGSYESDRPDSNRFRTSDLGKPLVGWPDEVWLNTRSRSVRNIMRARLSYAAQLGCDGVDPDNVDAYDNANGFGLHATDAVDYIHFLATEAHRRHLAIGLKNAGSLVPTVIGLMQWAVVEQCVQFDECTRFRPFIDAGKPVFHIEYPDDAANPSLVSTAAVDACADGDAQGFSTVLKDLELSSWVQYC
ncbi:hypothetical protein K3495_g5911 [Podosphaera aphanis]|nr:hypothetical protein K3495_g5911 [Podosphaera aphanis]